MASFLYEFVKPYVAKLIDGAIAEARHVFCFTCIVKEFEEERARLEPERITMAQRVKVAKERGKDIQAKVGSWEEEIDKLNQVDTKTKQPYFFGFCPDCIWRYKKGKELVNTVKRIKELKEKGEKFENIELPRCLPDAERYSSKDYISFESRKSKYEELLDALKDDNNYITGLQGMGGTGKTTLVKEVGKELKQSEQFAYVVDTTVSFTPDIKKIQDDLAGSLGLKWEDCNESDRPKKLWSRLTNGDKILLILDDVWDRGPRLDFEAIGIPKRDNHKGCRVLVTSRSKITFDIMDCHKTIELGLLSTEDAWVMFEWYAGICNSSSEILINKAREIAKECKQLPVAISVIASSLKGQQNREHEWDVTLKSLKQPVSMHGVDDDMVGIYNCLKISYDNLKDEKAKGLFLLCSVFREDEENSIEVLTRLCTGVGLLGEDYGSYDDARNQVVVAKNKLVDSCLLLEVNNNRLKMHDLVRDAAQWIANKEIQCIKLFDKKQKSLVENQTNIKYLLCEGKCMDFFNLKFDSSKLEILIVSVDGDEDRARLEVPKSFFENLIKLRVLYFSGNYNQLSLSLPDSIRSMTNIRSMSVESVALGDISILGNLESLETLDLKYCKIKELPNQITKLGKFKSLKLKCCEIRMNNPFEVIERCSSLEELYFKNSFNDFCQEITLPELQRYHINSGVNSLYSSSMERIKFPKYVLFDCDDDDVACQFSKGTLKYCMQTADALSLHGIEWGWRNLMPEIVPLELGMNDLVELHLYWISQLQCLVDTIGSQVPNVLSKLVVLQLHGMENLEELFNGPLSFESLNNLEKLSIKDCIHLRSLFKGKLNLCNLKTITLENCPMLASLFEASTSRSLVLLEELEISDCEGLKTIIADERREDEEIDDSGNNNKSHGSMFSKLKVIRIERCHLLESMLSFLSAQGLPVIKAIRIRECDGLKYVFGQSQHVELVSLSKLELYELPNFIGIFEECNHRMSSCVKGSHSTSNYGSKAEIQLDPIKCNAFSWWIRLCCQTTIPLVDDVDRDQPHDCSVASESNSHRLNIWERVQCLPIQSKILCNIKDIVLTHFPKMKSVFILSIDLIMQLETLAIMNCDELKHVIIDTGEHNTGGNICVNVFPKLNKLFVEDCAQLEYIFGHDTIINHQNYMEIQLHFPELRDLHLVGLPSLIATCPKQYRITFPSLKSLELGKCSQDNTIIKELSGNVDYFLTLQGIILSRCNVENIFSLDEIDGQQLDLGLRYIMLYDLPMMTCLFVIPKNSFALKNLTHIRILRCDKLKIAFSTAILRLLLELVNLSIEECKELEHIIEDDDGLENKNNSKSLSSTTCFPKLQELAVIKCNKLKSVFSTSMLRFLPELVYLRIEECKELEHIIEDDDGLENKQNSNSLSSTTCFPKLQGLAVINCNKLTYVLPFSVCKELPKLDVLLITKANELEEIFKSEDDQKVDIPNLNVVAFDMLPSLCCAQGNQFQAVKNCFVRNCQKLTLTSAEATDILGEFKGSEYGTGYDLYVNVSDLFEQLQSSETTEDFDTGSNLASIEIVENAGIEQLPSAKITEDFELPVLENVPDLTILPTNSKELLNERSMEQQHSLEEIDTIVQPSQLEGSTSEKTPVATIQVVPSKQKGIEIEGTSKTNNGHGDPSQKVEDLAILPTNSEIQMKQTLEAEHVFIPNDPDLAILPTSSEIQMKQTPETAHEYVENVLDLEQSLGETDTIVKPSQVHNLEESTSEKTALAAVSTISGTKNEPPLQVVTSKQKGVAIEETTKNKNDQVSPNGDAFMKVNSNVEERFSKDDEIIVSKSKPSPSIPSPIASQIPSMPSKGDPSKKVEDLSSSLVKRELEQLVSKNHLDYENLSLLSDFLVENPSVRLKDTSLSNKYKGCAYNSLAELLKFLKTHTLLEVSGSSHSEFVELLQDALSFAFDKDWLDGVERRALFPEIQVSPDALEKLLDFKKRVTKDVEDLRLKIDFLSQVAEDLKHQLTSSEAVLESIIQQEAVLIAPIGY
ncbi:uncharacterized protein LOC123886409 [Trifolium pratense]|uniref:uncharacterized protein LOC123886409 n=1 Tax=Trifolium pratense TaxID=57577 RepID=UPI001E6927D4|nr:uncharacterized protein LOC123886409 [Trifolium pratense]